MPTYDPLNPQNRQTADADFLRNQLNALKGLINTVPPGQVGPPGPQGVPGADGRGIASVNDDGTGRAVVALTDGSTCGPFSIASGPQGPEGNAGRSVVNVYDDGSGRCVIQMSDGINYGPFTIATGPQGMQGAQGPQGNNGNDGGQGPQGFNGSDGSPGQQGPQGPQGNPGEVSNADLTTALGGTSANSDGVAQLGLTVSDPPTQTELKNLANKLDELIATLKR